ncbi:hypothetical protein WDZ92_41510, partial [Nostoc sp. NIES-2111]
MLFLPGVAAAQDTVKAAATTCPPLAEYRYYVSAIIVRMTEQSEKEHNLFNNDVPQISNYSAFEVKLSKWGGKGPAFNPATDSIWVKVDGNILRSFRVEQKSQQADGSLVYTMEIPDITQLPDSLLIRPVLPYPLRFLMGRKEVKVLNGNYQELPILKAKKGGLSLYKPQVLLIANFGRWAYLWLVMIIGGSVFIFYYVGFRKNGLRDTTIHPLDEDNKPMPLEKSQFSMARTLSFFWTILIFGSVGGVMAYTGVIIPLNEHILWLMGITLTTTTVSRFITTSSGPDRIARPTAGFLYDICSDDIGVNPQRVQMLIANLLFAGYFIYTIYKYLTIPSIDPEWLALLGLSNASYLVQKPKENVQPPTVTPPPAPAPNPVP